MPIPTTHHKSVIPLSDQTRQATGSVQWWLERPEDAATPVFHYNNLEVLICGEDGFRRIAQDIRSAETSIDIICWGFDPAMELTREAGGWPRGDTWGDLLRDAAQGKLNQSKSKVRVRLLPWYDAHIAAIGGANLPGYNAQVDPEEGATSARAHSARSLFNARWFRDARAGAIEGLSMRTRGNVHDDVVAALRKEMEAAKGSANLGSPKVWDIGLLEQLGLEFAATHHQKTIVIDYEGRRPRAYVMGLNSVTDYWDTQAHVFNDPRRGLNSEGSDLDHSTDKDWTPASSGQPTLKPYQDYACRLEGDAVVAVYKNFVDAWNQARVHHRGSGEAARDVVDPKAPPARLYANLSGPCSQAQIVRTLPDKEGGEKSIARLYHQASSFARHYLYIENQYFQHAGWARALKEARGKFVQGFAQARPPVPISRLPVLHVMVVTPTPERGLMVPRTHDTVAELGHGDSMPNQDRNVQAELDAHAQYERDLAEYKQRRAPYDARQAPYPHLPPRVPPPLPDLAKSYQQASEGRSAQATRDLLSQTLGMRTLVASLWSWDKNWDEASLPIARRIEEERQRHAREKKAWDLYQAAQAKARADNLAAGGTGLRSADSGVPPALPPDRSQALKNAKGQRYREVYIHSKLMVIDDSMFTLGSANLNVRSFAVDSEMNIASDDAVLAKDLRQRVWAQHTDGRFDGGADATEPAGMAKTFRDWVREAGDNLDMKLAGKSLSCSLVKFLDERTSSFRAS